MNLQKISEAKDKMELMYNSIYDLQESNKKTDIEELKKEFEYNANKLYKSLLSIIYDDTKFKESLSKFEFLIEKCSGHSIEELKQNTRKINIALPRQVHMALLNLTYGYSLSNAARFYNKDHSTTIHSKTAFRNLYQTDMQFRDKYSEVIDHCIRFDLSRNSTKTQDFLNEK